jgi:site-specific DNA-cytosine methylase
MTLTAIDCQGFAGGFTLGVVEAGFTLVGKRENLGGFGVPLLEGNRHLLGQDWRAQATTPDRWESADVDLVFGNPPCSGFSNLSVSITDGKGGRGDWRGIDSSANKCMWDFVAFAAKCRPQVAIFESVQAAGRLGLPLMQALRADLEQRTGEQWSLHHVFHNNLSLGGCAQRKRYFWVTSRVPFGVEPVEMASVTTLRDRIGDLQDVPLGAMAGHVISTSLRARRLAQLATNAVWQPGEFSGDAYRRMTDNLDRLPLWDSMPKTDMGTSLYAARRWRYDEPARVITGCGLDENVHPELPRTFTHREVARILGFPDSWSCDPAIAARSMGAKWWGKGIPVESGRWIATAARESIEGRPGVETGTEVGDREYVIDLTHDWKRARRAVVETAV